jgi:glucans biosynthesis protein C
VLVVVAVRWLLVRLLGAERAGHLARRIGTALSSPVGVVLVAVPYAVGVSVQDVGVASILEPYTLVPVAGASIAYAGAFLAGWFLRADPEALGRVQRQWIPQLALAVVLTVADLLLPASAPAPLAAALAALAGWAWVYGLLGLAALLVTREISVVRYLADSSYWIYLMHLPLLLLVEIPLADLGLPILVKLVIALVTVLGALLLSYDLLVRPSWIGKWLSGRRLPRMIVRRRAAAVARS